VPVAQSFSHFTLQIHTTQDVTNQAKAIDFKIGKPKVYKRSASNNSRPITKKRDAFSTDFKSLGVGTSGVSKASNAEATSLVAEKLRNVKPSKEVDSKVSNAKAEVKRPDRKNSSLDSSKTETFDAADNRPASQKPTLAPFKELNKSPPDEKFEEKHSVASHEFDVVASSYQYSKSFHDIDERDADDPLCATSYVQDMYEHFRNKEVHTSVRPVYLEDQQFINERMRSILVDWLVEVHLKFKLVPETLYLTVNLIDRYLAKTEVSRPKLQLVGVTALLIASKYEEIYPPELRDLVYICDRAYSKLEVSVAKGEF
jgi:hypothetical protein